MNERSAWSTESVAIRISILLHVMSWAYSVAFVRLRSFEESLASLAASCSRNSTEEVLKDEPKRIIEDCLSDDDESWLDAVPLLGETDSLFLKSFCR